jgi:nucleoid-associated protein YgaU
MSMTSAAEANLDARVRPAISALRSRTTYPKPRAAAGCQVTAVAPPAAQAIAASPAVRSDRIRLTRRGRIVVGTLAAIGVAATSSAIWLAIAGHAQAASYVDAGQRADASVQRVVVGQGQTLWGIATHADPSADPRVVIAEIIDLNSLSGTAIQVGQVLLVPRS